MGYTHYWRKPRTIKPEVFRRIVEDFGKLILPLSDHGINLADPNGEGQPEITADMIAFNGMRNCGHPQNREVSIPWPSMDAGGLGNNAAGVDGAWFAGALLQHRCCDGSCDYESFVLERVETHGTPDENGRYFNWCKTAFRPYDIAVTAALLVAKHHMGDSIVVSTDGEDQHWFDAKMLCQTVLGYGIEYQIDESSALVCTEARTVAPACEPEPAPVKDTRPVHDISLTETAKLIRKELKARWPEVKFSVRSKSYSGGCSITVFWTDGPTGKQVKPILDRFEGCGFDGMQDLKTYNGPTEYNGERVSFHADYVHGQRSISFERMYEVADRVAYEIGAPMPTVKRSDYDGSGYVERGSIDVPYVFHASWMGDIAPTLDNAAQHICSSSDRSSLAQMIHDIAHAVEFVGAAAPVPVEVRQ